MRKVSKTTLLTFAILAIALAARLVPGPRTIDDSFITFRYARNILAGEGFVYNPGQAVLGTTTPLYTFLMVGLGALTGGTQANFPVNAWLLNALADVATCYLLARLGRRGGMPHAGLATALAWAVAPYSVTFSIGGLETSIYVLLLSGLAVAYIERRRALTGLLAALAILTRPDAVLLVGPFMLDRLYRALRRGEPLKAGELLAFFLPCLAWALFATLTFGSPVPQSVQAKLSAYILSEDAAFIRLIQHYTTPFMEPALLGVPLAVAVGLVLYPFLFLLGARRLRRVEPRLLSWLLYPWLYFVVFALPNPLIFRWYLSPPMPAYFMGILAGIEVLASGLLNLRRRQPAESPAAAAPGRLRTALPAILLIIPTLLSLNEWHIRPDHGPTSPAPGMAWFKLELLYRQAADFVAPQMTSATVLAAGDVGVLGYYTPARILDTVGLNSPESLPYYPLDQKYYAANYAIAPDLILDLRPDWIVILEVAGRLSLAPDGRFQAAYELVKKIPTDIYDSDGLLIFKKRTLPAAQ